MRNCAIEVEQSLAVNEFRFWDLRLFHLKSFGTSIPINQSINFQFNKIGQPNRI